MCHPSRCATRVALCTYARAAGLAVPRAAHPPGLLAGAASARLCHTGAAAAPTARPAGPVGTQRAQSGGNTPTRRGLPGGIPGTWSATTEHHFPGARQAELSLGCFPRSHRGAAPAHLECQGGHSPARGVERRGPTHPYSEPSRSGALFAAIWAKCLHVHVGFIPHQHICFYSTHVGPAGHVAYSKSHVLWVRQVHHRCAASAQDTHSGSAAG